MLTMLFVGRPEDSYADRIVSKSFGGSVPARSFAGYGELENTHGFGSRKYSYVLEL